MLRHAYPCRRNTGPSFARRSKSIHSFRHSDYNEKAGKLYYFYFGKDKSGRGGKATSNFLTAVINPSDMKVESNKVNTLAGEMAGSAYGD